VLSALREKGLVIAGEGASLSGEPELAFKHVLIRDVAYGMLPKAVRAQKHFEVAEFIEDRAGERLDEVVAVLAEHYGRGVQLAQDLKFESLPLARYSPKALQYAERAGDAASALYSNEEAFSHYASALGYVDGDKETAARIGEKQGDVALRLGRVDAAISVWEGALGYHRGQEDLQSVAELHRKLGAAYAHKGDRKQAIEHHQRGINLIKDGPPSLALVRLYEEAAWLYVQTGDNMLAIYASEKALRLAERLGEVGAASRAHGIFGRVFGRIGDLAKARENLERAVELARGSDDHETVLALLALGTHLEEAEGGHAGAGNAYREALELASQIGDVPAQVELYAALAQLAAYAAEWDELERCAETSAELAEREGLVGKLCLPYALRGVLHWRSGAWDESGRAYRRALELAEQVGWSDVSFGALFGLARMLSDQGDPAGADGTLAQALDVCERAGLIVQSIQAGAARAQLLEELGRADQAMETAQEARKLAGRVHHPVGHAASSEAAAVAEPAHAAEHLRRAREAWAALGRPLEAARCRLLLATRAGDWEPGAKAKLLAEAADEYQRLGVGHRAQRARELSVR
jgi:tetratricopeptide (TPR) repeat protein